MRIVSWNVNSIRAREDRVQRWVEDNRPDVLCLQETKVTDDKFPENLFKLQGYHSVFHGQKTYNGVAILTPHEIEASEVGFDGTEDEAGARLLGARVGGVWVYSCYVPNGQVIGSPASETKLRWLERLRTRLEQRHKRDEHLAVCGDFNIAIDDRDTHDPAFWQMQVLYHPSMRQALKQFQDAFLVDTFRLHHEEGERYSWWDYRQLAFPKNRGLRIDYVFASPSLAPLCSAADIDREARKGKSPSDHAPVWATFDL